MQEEEERKEEKWDKKKGSIRFVLIYDHSIRLSLHLESFAAFLSHPQKHAETVNLNYGSTPLSLWLPTPDM